MSPQKLRDTGVCACARWRAFASEDRLWWLLPVNVHLSHQRHLCPIKQHQCPTSCVGQSHLSTCHFWFVGLREQTAPNVTEGHLEMLSVLVSENTVNRTKSNHRAAMRPAVPAGRTLSCGIWCQNTDLRSTEKTSEGSKVRVTAPNTISCSVGE